MCSWESGTEKPRAEERERGRSVQTSTSIRTCLRCLCQKDSEQKIDLVSCGQGGEVCWDGFLWIVNFWNFRDWWALRAGPPCPGHGEPLGCLCPSRSRGCPSHLSRAFQACRPLRSIDISRRPSWPSSSLCSTFVPCVPELILLSTRMFYPSGSLACPPRARSFLLPF